MARIGIFYGSSKGATKKIARLLRDLFGEDLAEIHEVKRTKAKRALDYELIILGSPTYEKGKLQEDWYPFLDKLKKLDLTGRSAAVFALGDQKKYSKTFADALEPLHRRARKCGARMIGAWPADGYEFDKSTGIMAEKFLGLVLDEERQAGRSRERLEAWAAQLEAEWRGAGLPEPA